jgi:alkylated DNA repair protein (DNA oxidative demethylase)
LLPLRDEAATFAGLAPGALEHALLTEYREGAAIGRHKDRSVFGEM